MATKSDLQNLSSQAIAKVTASPGTGFVWKLKQVWKK